MKLKQIGQSQIKWHKTSVIRASLWCGSVLFTSGCLKDDTNSRKNAVNNESAIVKSPYNSEDVEAKANLQKLIQTGTQQLEDDLAKSILVALLVKAQKVAKDALEALNNDKMKSNEASKIILALDHVLMVFLKELYDWKDGKSIFPKFEELQNKIGSCDLYGLYNDLSKESPNLESPNLSKAGAVEDVLKIIDILKELKPQVAKEYLKRIVKQTNDEVQTSGGLISQEELECLGLW